MCSSFHMFPRTFHPTICSEFPCLPSQKACSFSSASPESRTINPYGGSLLSRQPTNPSQVFCPDLTLCACCHFLHLRVPDSATPPSARVLQARTGGLPCPPARGSLSGIPNRHLYVALFWQTGVLFTTSIMGRAAKRADISIKIQRRKWPSEV